MVNVKDLVITSLETITAFDVLDGSYKFTLDELQNASIAQTQDTSEITGKGGRKLATLKRNKSVTVSGDNGMVSGGLLEMQSGGTFTNGATKVHWTDYVTVGTVGEGQSAVQHAATTAYKAVGTSGAEIIGCFIRSATDGTLGTELKQDSAVASGKFKYTPGTKLLEFNDDIADGTEIVVFYERKITADVLENKSDVFSGKCTLYIDALAEDKCANVYRVQFFIPKADFNGEFTFEMGDNQTVHSFEAEALAGACGAAGTLWTYTVFGANTADYTGA